MSGGPLTIALVAACPFPSRQGSQVFVGQMASRLAAAGHRVHLLTYGQGAEQAGLGYRHHRIARLPGDDSSRSGPNLAKPFLDAMLARRLVSLCREQRVDVVHAHNYEAAVAALAARAVTGTPVVYHSHNLMGDELGTYFDGPFARVAAAAGRFLDRTVPARADRTIALCEWSAARLREAGCPDEALAVIPPAVDDEGPLAPRDDDARAAFGLEPGDFVVAYVGNLDRYQNLSLLLEAVKRLGSSSPGGGGPVRLLLATHSAQHEVDRVARGAGLGERLVAVEVAGHLEARRALAAADVVALPRRLGSGYPVKLLNSMSAARAVVSAGCGSKVLRDGVDGLVVGDDDADALAAAIERLRADEGLRASLAAAARAAFLAGLTWEAVLPRVEAVYGGLREPSSHPEAPSAGTATKPAGGARAPGRRGGTW